MNERNVNFICQRKVYFGVIKNWPCSTGTRNASKVISTYFSVTAKISTGVGRFRWISITYVVRKISHFIVIKKLYIILSQLCKKSVKNCDIHSIFMEQAYFFFHLFIRRRYYHTAKICSLSIQNYTKHTFVYSRW